MKLAHLDAHNAERRKLADVYRQALEDVQHPVVKRDVEHVYHLYVVRHPLRDALRAALRKQGMETAIHYPLPVHLQPAYADLGFSPGSLPATEQATATILSLPMYVGLDADAIVRVGRTLNSPTRKAA